MRATKSRVSLAFRLWVLATVFVWPFIGFWGIAAWAAVGAALGLWWLSLPEDPPAPPQRLPYQHLYPHLAHPPAEPGLAKNDEKSL
jgi:thiol:disulfide interchange protein